MISEETLNKLNDNIQREYDMRSTRSGYSVKRSPSYQRRLKTLLARAYKNARQITPFDKARPEDITILKEMKEEIEFRISAVLDPRRRPNKSETAKKKATYISVIYRDILNAVLDTISYLTELEEKGE